MITIYNKYKDGVIDSIVANGETTYEFALEKVHKLIDRFSSQRKLLDKKFYARLERDILKGCMMPPITIAFVKKDGITELSSVEDIQQFINDNISKGYILDGIQRLNTLERAKNNAPEKFNLKGSLLLNVIIAKSEDKLLYRMITLNNGQKPMTPRHQIEILTQELFDFSELDIDVQTEKERSEKIIRGSFNLGDISRGYLAFLTNSVHNENDKIISEKMDQILVGRILDSEVVDSKIEFKDILTLVDILAKDEEIRKWLKVSNNFIGFCVGVKSSYDIIKDIDLETFKENIQTFETAFKSINPSKVNLGRFRRELSSLFIKEYSDLSDKDADELMEVFFDKTA